MKTPLYHIRQIASVVLFAIAAHVHAQTAAPHVNKYDGPEFAISYPDHWHPDDSGKQGPAFFIFSVLDNENDKFRENISIVSQDPPSAGMTAATIAEAAVKDMDAKTKNGKLVSSADMKTQNGMGRRIVYTTDQGTVHVKLEQLYLLAKGKMYVLTFLSEADKYDRYKSAADMMFRSFAVK